MVAHTWQDAYNRVARDCRNFGRGLAPPLLAHGVGIMTRSNLAIAICLPLIMATQSLAQDTRYYEQDGVTYRETRQVVQRPVTETKIHEQQETVYVEQYRTQVEDRNRIVSVPTTEYKWQPKLTNRWNPLARPSIVWQMVPETRWEMRQEKVTMPVTERTLVPETRIRRVPVTTQRYVPEEIISRMAVSDRPSDPFTSTPSVASRPGEVGGIGRLDNDPPRRSQLR